MNQQILGTNDYLKMTCVNADDSALSGDECEYETNIAFLGNINLLGENVYSTSNQEENKENNIEMSILESSLTKTANILDIDHGNRIDQHYDNLTTI